MLSLLTALLAKPAVSYGAGLLSVVAFPYLLGLFRGSAPYKAVRNALGVFSANLGESVSRIGNTKLKGFYEPIEAVLIDFFLFMAEQFAVGLRRDNPDKMADHVERLQGVGSEVRVEAIRKKMVDALGEVNQEVESDPVKKAADEAGKDLTEGRLK